MESLCKQCGKEFTCRSSLSEHDRRYNGRLHINAVDIASTSKANLTRHRCSVYGVDKSFKCGKCANSFSLLDEDLQRHERQESCGPRLKCDTCEVSFHNKPDLDENMDKLADRRDLYVQLGRRTNTIKAIACTERHVNLKCTLGYKAKLLKG